VSPATLRLQQLVTHHAGVTVVQSLTSHFAVATTLKFVRGSAAVASVSSGDRDELLSSADDLPDESTNKFDTDIGVMVAFGTVRAGLTLRNLTEPDFGTPSGETLELKRQTRAGVSYTGLQGLLILSADIDIERGLGSIGEVRDLAAGAEAHIMPRAFVRGGFRFNTLSDQPGGHAPAYALGTSVLALRKLIVDAQITRGSRAADRGWGVAARLLY
jgi:hypothetical protein